RNIGCPRAGRLVGERDSRRPSRSFGELPRQAAAHLLDDIRRLVLPRPFHRSLEDAVATSSSESFPLPSKQVRKTAIIFHRKKARNRYLLRINEPIVSFSTVNVNQKWE
ncbi:hypothetical protein, partial [Mesorhizobium sp. M8A.F.Ca.ET.197.01.1.1]|uniref:hypothetical protein n=1 Tax=Mesorhizobium sp. M8A.F.Ca.ET.197.01.1.1 TaxID=2563965 RepID=UPI001AEE13F8